MPRTHRTTEETRSLVAEAVVDFVAHHGIAVWPEIPMEAILESAGVSRASAYRIWSGRSAFSAFALEQCLAGHAMATLGADRALALAREVVEPEDGDGESSAQASGTSESDARSTDPSRVESAARFIALAADEELDLLLGSDRWRAFVRFQAVALDAPTPELAEVLDRIDSEDSARVRAVYERVARAWGLEAVSPAGTAVIAEAALLLARSAVARIVSGRDEARMRSTYIEGLSSLVRGAFRERPGATMDLAELAG
ncbi:Uncharacterised protein [Brevibacterium casei]|uniref:HTH tetR-type domain-containing protein n=1 Tax=Brevibacterium casei TaxID=33889 RepID=A0A449DBR1_9MICO|nr:hypothetical protein [Brevibacterium casei]QPS34363.1 hypothetical protein I6G59_03245 [Brevibacterium casei]VEW15006.1 Uncharacterised protein [Brevibacterium casei]